MTTTPTERRQGRPAAGISGSTDGSAVAVAWEPTNVYWKQINARRTTTVDSLPMCVGVRHVCVFTGAKKSNQTKYAHDTSYLLYAQCTSRAYSYELYERVRVEKKLSREPLTGENAPPRQNSTRTYVYG